MRQEEKVERCKNCPLCSDKQKELFLKLKRKETFNDQEKTEAISMIINFLKTSCYKPRQGGYACTNPETNFKPYKLDFSSIDDIRKFLDGDIEMLWAFEGMEIFCDNYFGEDYENFD